MSIIEALAHQEVLQTLYTGGTVFHAYLGERISGESAKSLARKIAENTKIPYFTLTPTFSICPEHGYLPEEQWTCPYCGRKTEVYSRVVGYFRPVQAWNEGKKEEFRLRLKFNLNAMEGRWKVYREIANEVSAPVSSVTERKEEKIQLILM